MLSVLENEMFAKIRVRDFGLGIDPGEENQIFRRFYRGNRVTTQAGFGIGLYLAREIVSRHGGFLLAKRMEPGIQMEISIPKEKKDTGCQKIVRFVLYTEHKAEKADRKNPLLLFTFRTGGQLRWKW